MSKRRRMAAALAVVPALVSAGCSSEVVAPDDAGHEADAGAGWSKGSRFAQASIDKVDLLLMIDNSRGMAEKQELLAAAIPDLIRGLTSPPCVTTDGTVSAQQPAGPLDACPDPATKRRFPPFRDIHLGVITSSIGGHGSDACPASETFSCTGGAVNPSNDDKGHLVTRSDPCGSGALPTYQGKGFLAWDPVGKANSPPGESQLGSVSVDPATGAITTVSPGLVPALVDLVRGAGQIGCGYESSLESWYRFLVDPEPYQTLSINPSTGRAEPQGIDDVLLQERKDFLRPSSLVAIIGLTDENDCSIREYGQFYFAAQQRDPSNPNKTFHLPRARSECATDPNDKCCRSCGQDQTGCPVDPSCSGSLDDVTDDVNLRCFDQKRRFGIDFLYPIDRYLTALTSALVPNRNGDMVPNPLFTDLDPTDADENVRDPSMVYLSFITGVPWQDIARQSGGGQPDLVGGLDPMGRPIGGFKSANELAVPDAKGHTVWDYIIGDPSNYVPPLDPLMRESIAPRSGQNPFTGDSIAPPSAAPGPGPNAINGHEYTPGTKNGVQVAPDDLQFACIFPLRTPRDCSDPSVTSCDCRDPKNDNPLCEPVDPNDPASPRTKQVRSAVHPGIRQLTLLRELGPQGIVGSICPANVDDPSSPAFGYRPAVATILDRIGERLGAEVSGVCGTHSVPVDGSGHIACALIEARNTGGTQSGAAACDAFCNAQPGRAAVLAARAELRNMTLSDPAAQQIGADCACEIVQLSGPADCGSITSPLAACQCDPAETPMLEGQAVNGWCYVDPTASPPVGNPEITKGCPAESHGLVRLVGAGQPAPGAVVIMYCAAQ